MSDIYTAETIPCSTDANTLPPERAIDAQVVLIPRDSDWSGFSLEMAAILSEWELDGRH